MKPINLTLNNLDFVMYPFQKTRMNGESTMIDYAIGISNECFSEIDYGFNPAVLHLSLTQLDAKKCSNLL